MKENEEIVFSKMGLDPILLLEESPKLENYTVHIIRPGEDKVEKKEEKEEGSKTHVKEVSANPEEAEDVKEGDTNIDLNVEKNELNDTPTNESEEDPRRKRRRSSASS